MSYILSTEEIWSMGFDWPKHPIIKQYLIEEDGKLDLPQMIERMQSSRAFYQKKINEAVAFKQQTGADYADFTDRFDDIVQMEFALGNAIAYLKEIIAFKQQTGAG